MIKEERTKEERKKITTILCSLALHFPNKLLCSEKKKNHEEWPYPIVFSITFSYKQAIVVLSVFSKLRKKPKSRTYLVFIERRDMYPITAVDSRESAQLGICKNWLAVWSQWWLQVYLLELVFSCTVCRKSPKRQPRPGKC